MRNPSLPLVVLEIEADDVQRANKEWAIEFTCAIPKETFSRSPSQRIFDLFREHRLSVRRHQNRTERMPAKAHGPAGNDTGVTYSEWSRN